MDDGEAKQVSVFIPNERLGEFKRKIDVLQEQACKLNLPPWDVTIDEKEWRPVRALGWIAGGDTERVRRNVGRYGGKLVWYDCTLFIVSGMMMAKTSEVFLVSGQFLRSVDGVKQLAPEIEQCVVVAHNRDSAYGTLAVSEPAFRPLGHATLQDYELAARKIVAAVGGASGGVLLAPGMHLDAAKDQIFLMSGQESRHTAAVERVVVARDAQAARGVLAANEPAFLVGGLFSLQDYERAAGKLRAVLRGMDSGWKLLVAQGM